MKKYLIFRKLCALFKDINENYTKIHIIFSNSGKNLNSAKCNEMNSFTVEITWSLTSGMFCVLFNSDNDDTHTACS